MRIHSDGGGEFTGQRFEEMSSEVGVWKTVSAPYHPQSNGRAERAIQKVKSGAISMLLHAKLPVKYWLMTMREYTFKQRHSILIGQIPDDAPTMGDNIMFKPETVGDMMPKAELGRFLCNDDRCPGGALILVYKNGKDQIIRTYCPRLVNFPRKKWKTTNVKGRMKRFGYHRLGMLAGKRLLVEIS